MVFGEISGTSCMILRGRFHSYEGHSMDDCVLPVYLARKLGCEIVLVTNAAGGINRDFQIGDIVLVSDHIGIPLLAGKGPLVGPNRDEFGPRFPAMSNAYDEKLRVLAIKCAQKLSMGKFVRSRGTYAFVSGPQYETSAECAFLRSIGADNVGMSTVPEVVAAKHCGLRVLCMSLVTNKVVFPGDVKPKHATHEEVLETTAARTNDMIKLVSTILGSLNVEDLEVNLLSGHTASTSADSGMVEAGVLDGGGSDMPNGGHIASAVVHPAGSSPVEKRLSQMNLATMTPLQAMSALAELQALLQR